MQVNLSRGYKAEVSRVDYRRVVLAGPWFTHVDSKKKTVYAERNVQKTDGTWTMQKLHRFIKNVSDPNVLVDHRDGNGLNNTRRNLRKVTASQSQQNRSKQSNNTTGISGVSWNTNAEKYEAHIKLAGKKKHLGLYTKLADAELAVNSAKRKYYGSFVRQI